MFPTLLSLTASDKGTDPGEMAGGGVEGGAGGVGVVPQRRSELQPLCRAALLLAILRALLRTHGPFPLTN